MTYLDEERHQLRTEMHATLSEAEYYRRALTKFPEAHSCISSLLDAALERGGSLKGGLDANIKLRSALAAEEKCA